MLDGRLEGPPPKLGVGLRHRIQLEAHRLALNDIVAGRRPHLPALQAVEGRRALDDLAALHVNRQIPGVVDPERMRRVVVEPQPGNIRARPGDEDVLELLGLRVEEVVHARQDVRVPDRREGWQILDQAHRVVPESEVVPPAKRRADLAGLGQPAHAHDPDADGELLLQVDRLVLRPADPVHRRLRRDVLHDRAADRHQHLPGAGHDVVSGSPRQEVEGAAVLRAIGLKNRRAADESPAAGRGVGRDRLRRSRRGRQRGSLLDILVAGRPQRCGRYRRRAGSVGRRLRPRRTRRYGQGYGARDGRTAGLHG